MALTVQQKIEKAYKAEIDAAWDVMSKRMDRALKKRDKELSNLGVRPEAKPKAKR